MTHKTLNRKEKEKSYKHWRVLFLAAAGAEITRHSTAVHLPSIGWTTRTTPGLLSANSMPVKNRWGGLSLAGNTTSLLYSLVFSCFSCCFSWLFPEAFPSAITLLWSCSGSPSRLMSACSVFFPVTSLGSSTEISLRDTWGSLPFLCIFPL